VTATTHYAFSYLLCAAAGVEPATAAAASLFSLLPDIDHPESTIGRVFRPLSKYIQRKYGHRTVTHSIFAIMFIAAALLPLLLIPRLLQWGGPFWTGLYAASLLAFSSHIFIDLFNKSGVRIFSPFSQKEYISFKTPQLRVLVSSWQEYLILFIIIFFAFTVTGEGFSIHKAVRNVGKMLYKNYDNAVKDYQEHIERRIVVADLPVLNMYPQTGIFLRNGERLVIGKENINEITVDKTEKLVVSKRISGSDPELLKSIPDGSYISGTIDVKNYFPEIKSNNFMVVDRRADGAGFTLKCAAPWEISRLLNLHNEIGTEIEKLKMKLCSYQIDQLRGEESTLKKRIETLRVKGLYHNYGRISKHTAELKKIQGKISSLEMKESMGGDAEIQEKINLLTNGFHFWFDLVVFEI
jgi:membrane-bound metal-dependent hydrolase YbcI (DUF457 family)